MWHERTREPRKKGQLQIVAIIQEQHPDRCALFMQWKHLDWPVLVDSLDLLGVRGVPLMFLIDEYGIVRYRNVSPESLATFLKTTYAAPPATEPQAKASPPGAEGEKDPAAWLAYGDSLFVRDAERNLEASILAYTKAVTLGAPPSARFRLGVALRRRYDSGLRKPGDFQHAVDAWSEALRLDPGHYIWRRRIQQYGPRLEKPYAFYDWVKTAREEIRRRGENPVPLRVEPRGSELAAPARSFQAQREKPTTPDPGEFLPRDEVPMVEIEAAVVPSRIQPGKAARIHVILRPRRDPPAHWNNEAGGATLWIDPPAGLRVEGTSFKLPDGKGATSSEPREMDFEIQVPAGTPAGSLKLPGHACYFVCDDKSGTCMYLRQDFEIRVKITDRR